MEEKKDKLLSNVKSQLKKPLLAGKAYAAAYPDLSLSPLTPRP